MKSFRIHILGASGSGVTTLGSAIAGELAFPHHDADDYYWLPTVPPFTRKRAPADRIRLMREIFTRRADWVLSGSMISWGEEIHRLFDHVIFVTAPEEVRAERVLDRERRHFGAEAVAPGGWRHADTQAFVKWVAGYERGDRPGRSLARHEAWLAGLSCPVLRVDGQKPVMELVDQFLNFAGKPV
ncbi:MAG: hypothetical protein AAF441_20490 [Pseudomonadota bacterium]